MSENTISNINNNDSGDNNDWADSSLWRRWTFSIANAMLKVGQSRSLQISDTLPLSAHDRSQAIFLALKSRYYASGASPFLFLPRLLVAMVTAFKYECAVIVFYTFVEGALRIAMPVVLYAFLDALGSAQSSLADNLKWALILSALGFGQFVVHHVLWFFSQRLGWNWKNACTVLIYDRLFLLPPSVLTTNNIGNMVNLISNDVFRFENFSAFMWFFISSIFELAVILALVIQQLNIASGFAGVGMTVAFIPFQFVLAARFTAVRTKSAAFTDQRIRYVSEVIDGISTVKSYGWNIPFFKLIESLRLKEVEAINHSHTFRAINFGLYYFTPLVAAFAAFAVFWGTGGTLEIPVVFSTISLLQVLRNSLALQWSRSVERGSEALSACARIEKLLNTQAHDGKVTMVTSQCSSLLGKEYSKLPSGEQSSIELPNMMSNPQLSTEGELCHIRKSSYYHGDNNSVQPTLRDIAFSVKQGELLMVVGAVGSGKSSLLSVLLGEINQVGGETYPNTQSSQMGVSRLAYCTQRPWILAASVRTNVVLAGQYSGPLRTPENVNEDLYSRSMECCHIVDDLESWAAYDETEIGERGVSLSGGQKARIALARAVYSDANLYLLDDPLSACDAHVGKGLFHDCIVDMLQHRGKGVILVTHQLQYMKYASKILVLDNNGHQSFYGSYEELSNRSSEFPQLGLSSSSSYAELPIDTGATVELKPSKSRCFDISKRTIISIKRDDSVADSTNSQSSRHEIIQAEDRAIGHRSYKNLWSYLRSGGLLKGAFVLLLALFAQGLSLVTDYWLRWWASSTFGDQNDIIYVVVLAGLTFLCVFIGVYRAQAWFRFSMNSSSKLQSRALWAVLHSPLAFFAANPTGRILNRFSLDQNQSDELLPVTVFDFIQSFLICLGGVVVACISIPWLALMIPFLTYSFLAIRQKYLKSSIELKRIDAITKSPIYSDFSATCDGLPTLRAYKLQSTFTEQFLNTMDTNARVWYSQNMIARWFGFRLDFLAFLLLLAVSILAAFLSQTLDVGLVGFALVNVFSLGTVFQWTVRLSTDVENQLTSVERINAYAKLPQESGYSTTLQSYKSQVKSSKLQSHESQQTVSKLLSYKSLLKTSPPTPSTRAILKNIQGRVQLSNLFVTYRNDFSPVIRGITATFPSGSKIGVCGRTGSGKSSLILALLRLNIITEGDILIDGESLLSMDLDTARSIISVIPQDPHLFSGTIRFNIDPFDRYTDDEIWSALKDACIDSFLSNEPLGLLTRVEENGKNFSVGQRQLFSMSRAILRGCRVILMDEVTASIDYATDKLIQTTIRTSPYLKSTTIITVAHRLRTIADSDLIVVMSDGCIGEMGAPSELLSASGLFYRLAVESGEFSDISDIALSSRTVLVSPSNSIEDSK